MVRMVREKLVVEEKKRKELKTELSAKSEKIVEELPWAIDVEMEELKPDVKEKESVIKDEEKKGPQGIIQFLLFGIILLITSGFSRI